LKTNPHTLPPLRDPNLTPLVFSSSICAREKRNSQPPVAHLVKGGGEGGKCGFWQKPPTNERQIVCHGFVVRLLWLETSGEGCLVMLREGT
jgi:hypothetical protein